MGRSSMRGVSYDKKFVKQPVIPNQAVTPSQMVELARQGIPISTQMTAYADTSSVNPSWEVPLENRRRVDANDLYEAQQDAREKVKKAHKRDRDMYDSVN